MSIRNIIEEGIRAEKLSRDFYRGLMNKSIVEYTGKALARIAEEENRHVLILEEYQRSLQKGGVTDIPEAGQHADVWAGFMKALDGIWEAIHPHTDEITVVQKAIALEIKGIELYTKGMESSENRTGKEFFSFMVKQETTHRDYFEKLLKRLLVLYEEPPEARPQL
jgi:rubrerythrin